MKKSVVKNIFLPVIVLAVVIVSLSSCQRGYGCPYKMQAKVEAGK